MALAMTLIFVSIKVLGAYICGEKMAIKKSLEERQDKSRLKLPCFQLQLEFGVTQLVNNVNTLVVFLKL